MTGYLDELYSVSVEDFFAKAGGASALTTRDMVTMQLNIGRACNLACSHCHVEAGPNRTELMDRDVMEACVKVFEKNGFSIADITGGAPEMNPNLGWLIEALSPLGKVMVRSNLAILDDEEYSSYIDVYRKNKVELICSLPCYGKDGVEDQRGKGVYEPCIRILKKLNEIGYGIDPELPLNLVFNPGSPSLPPAQSALEKDYKASLSKEHGIVFNELYTITNSPLGRFGKRLIRENQLESYMELLSSTFNGDTVSRLMCLSQLSIGWDGTLYDCDGNQAAELPIEQWSSIFDLVEQDLSPRIVKTGPHCYSCTAGCGSSCGGSLSDSTENSCCCSA